MVGLTLWRTFYIFKESQEVRSTNKLTTLLAYNGTTFPPYLTRDQLIALFIGSIQFGSVHPIFFTPKLEDVAGSDEVALSRKFGNEKYVFKSLLRGT